MKIYIVLFCITCFTAYTLFAQTFNAQPDYALQIPHELTGIKITDITGDGKADIMAPYIASGPEKLVILPGNGQGNFGSLLHIDKGDDYFRLATGDLNKDNIPDFVLSSYRYNSVRVHLGKGNATFDAGTYYHLGAHSGLITIHDINLDGNTDMLVLTSGSGTSIVLHVFLGKGDGTFLPKKSFPSKAITGFEMNIADINYDGLPDVHIKPGSSYYLTYLQQKDGSFMPFYQKLGYLIIATAVADVNKDNMADLVTISGSDSQANTDTLIIQLGNGAGDFPTIHYKQYPVKSMDNIHVQDFNKDGYMDIIGKGIDFFAIDDNDIPFDEIFTNKLYYYTGKPDGTFDLKTELTVPDKVKSLSSADLNNDGYTDIIAFGMNKNIYTYVNRTKPANGNEEDPVQIKAFPNPFNRRIQFQFSLPETTVVTLTIVDATGKKVATLVSDELQASQHTFYWQPTKQLSGMYFYVLTAGNLRKTGKIMLMNSNPS